MISALISDIIRSLVPWKTNELKVVGFEPATGPLFYFRENIRINAFDKY